MVPESMLLITSLPRWLAPVRTEDFWWKQRRWFLEITGSKLRRNFRGRSRKTWVEFWSQTRKLTTDMAWLSRTRWCGNGLCRKRYWLWARVRTRLNMINSSEIGIGTTMTCLTRQLIHMCLWKPLMSFKAISSNSGRYSKTVLKKWARSTSTFMAATERLRDLKLKISSKEQSVDSDRHLSRRRGVDRHWRQTTTRILCHASNPSRNRRH